MAYPFKIKMAITALMITICSTLQGGYKTTNFSSCCEEISCPQTCCTESCGKFFLEAELLYLRALQGGLSTVCDSTDINNVTENGIVISTLEGRGRDPDFKWNFGYRVGAGYEFARNNCDIEVYWTHYNVDTGDQGTTNAHKWKIDFNTIDVLYACKCDWSTCFILTPFGGLRYARIDQKLRTNFISTVDGAPITSNGSIKEEFFGVGPLFGVGGELWLGCGFSLYGEISGAILYGTYHVNSDINSEFNTGINISHFRKHIQAFQPVVDAGVGIRWKTCYCNNSILIMQLGIEQHNYFNHNQFCSYGDLNLNGISFGLGIEF